MSRENVEMVRAMFAAFVRGDYEASLAAYAETPCAYAEDTVWDDTRYRPDGAVHVGHAALANVVRTWRGAWERYESEAEKVLDAGRDRVAVVMRETGEGKGGGCRVDEPVRIRHHPARLEDHPHDGLSNAEGSPRSRGLSE